MFILYNKRDNSWKNPRCYFAKGGVDINRLNNEPRYWCYYVIVPASCVRKVFSNDIINMIKSGEDRDWPFSWPRKE